MEEGDFLLGIGEETTDRNAGVIAQKPLKIV